MRSFATIIGGAAVVALGVASVAIAMERLKEPCQPGYVKKVVHEAGSCLGDYKNRRANEPIAFCTRARETCVLANTPTPKDAAQPEAPTPAQTGKP